MSLAGVAGKTLYIIAQGSDASLTLNAGNSAFSYLVPVGFTPGWPGSSPGTWTTFSPAKAHGSAVLSGGNLTLNTPTVYGACQSVDGYRDGKFYFELTNNGNTVFSTFLGGGAGRLFPGIDYSYWANNGTYGPGDGNGGGVLVSSGFNTYPCQIATCGTVFASNIFSYVGGDIISFAVQPEPAPSGTPKANIGNLMFGNTTSFVDLSIEDNRRLFCTEGGCSVDPGTNGSAAFGIQPAVFLTRNSNDAAGVFATNRGAGGSFTISGGTLTTAATQPCCNTVVTPTFVITP